MVTYLGLVVAGFVLWLLFQARGILAAVLASPKMEVGDYDAALRRARLMSLGVPNVTSLHFQGLILFQAGRPAEAEPLYRKALGMLKAGSRHPGGRIHASLGRALLDLGRYDEAERCFHEAIEAGDGSGGAEDGLAEMRLVCGGDAEAALDYSRQAIEHAKRREDGRVPGAYHVHQAWALALLGRSEEARASLDKAFREPAPPVARTGRTAGLHWNAGMTLLAMQQPAEARQHFQTGAEADPRGKYGRRCAEQLRRTEQNP